MIAPVDVTNIRIETKRLVLRPWQETDLEDFYEYASVDGVGQRCGWLPHENMEKSAMILASFIQEKKTLALELKENRKVIGSIGLEMREADLELPGHLQGREIGYVLNKDYWGRGLMPEAVQAVIRYCFDTLNFDWLTCGHFLWNHQSRRVVEKCGFRYLRDVVHQTRFGTQEPTKLYILDREDHIFLKMNAHFDVTGLQLETSRLILRPLEEGDWEDCLRMDRLPEVTEFLGRELSCGPEAARQRFERHLKQRETLALVLKETGAYVGSIALQGRNWPAYPIDHSLRGREFAFDLHPDYWGRGLMPEAVQALTEYVFRELHFDFVSAGYFLGNDKSRRVMEKCGMEFLFDDDLKLSDQRTVRVFTHIRYKEKEYV